MRARRIFPTVSLPIALALGGCGYVHIGRLPEAAPTVVGDEKLRQENAGLQLEKKMLQQELALTRAQGEALRGALENRAADGETSKQLVEKLNATTRELAALRVQYAQLRSEKEEAVTTASEANALKARLGAAEEKLAASLRTYTELQNEITQLRGEVDRARAENVVLGEKVRVATAKNERLEAALTQLNTDLLAQKHARVQAEQDAETLRGALQATAPNTSALAQQRAGSAPDARSLVAEHAAETAALKQQVETLNAKLDTLATEDAQAKQQLRAENDQLKAQLAQLTSAASTSAPTQPPLESARPTNNKPNADRAPVRVALRSAPPVTAPAPATSTAESAAGSTSHVEVADTTTPRPSGVVATLVTSVQRPGRPNIERNGPGGPTRFHVVVSGDTLSRISSRYYGTPGRWGDILAANRDVLGETNTLIIGRTLRIP